MLTYIIDKNTKTIVRLVDFDLLTETEKNSYKANYLIYELINGIDPTTKFVKAKYENNNWQEGATEEEIRALEEKNKNHVTVTDEQQLLSTVLLENANIKEQLKQQQELYATLTLQVAELREEKANV